MYYNLKISIFFVVKNTVVSCSRDIRPARSVAEQKNSTYTTFYEYFMAYFSPGHLCIIIKQYHHFSNNPDFWMNM